MYTPAVKTMAGYASHNRISGTRTPPFRFANRPTMASLNRPEQLTSATRVPISRPRNSNPCMRGESVAYADGTMVITDRIHQYHVNEYPITATAMTGKRNVRRNRVREA